MADDYKNRYPGVNPHLNSRLQSPGGGWEMFHAECIARLVDELDNLLPGQYIPFVEKSLQVTLVEPETDVRVAHLGVRRPDVIITYQSQGSSAPAPEAATPTLTLPLIDSLTEDDFPMSVVIYRFEARELPGIPVTRIELLSPANKPGGAHHLLYLRNRHETLAAGLRLVEIDWLHETPPVSPLIPSYPAESGAYPYYILVSDPRPTLEQGQTHVYGRHIWQALPAVNIPLDGSDLITVDFNRVYNQTIERRRFYSLTDNTRLPARFETYSEADQAYIRRRMAEIDTEKT